MSLLDNMVTCAQAVDEISHMMNRSEVTSEGLSVSNAFSAT